MRVSARVVLCCAALAAAVWVGRSVQAQSAIARVPRSAFSDPLILCGTQPERDGHRFRKEAVAAPIADGEALSFEQSPPLLTPDYNGDLQLKRFLVVGDFPSVQFKRAADDGVETWPRVTTISIGGRLISVFEPTWHGSDVSNDISQYHVGIDHPELYWGTLQPPGAANAERSVWLRMSFGSIPPSPVQKINDRVQYASNVVNLVIPDFEDSRVANGLSSFNFAEATTLFYQSFPDKFDSIAFIPASSALGDYSAFHSNVKNAVAGIGLTTFDSTSQYGSAGALQSIELYGAGHFALNEVASHEFAHQWGDFLNWPKLAGITLAGHQPGAHAPLWYAGETMIGAVLFGDRRVAQNGASYQIEETPFPIHYHETEQYLAGWLPASQVHDIRVFQDQGQFSSGSASRPDAGTPVQGASALVTINDIVREHGTRSGPVASTWRRAWVVVSRDGLISQEQMNYYNFMAQRLGDRGDTGVPSVEGYGSPYAASNGKVKVRTNIEPSAGPTLAETFDINNPGLAQGDLRGLSLASPLPNHIKVGQAVTMAGRVTATDHPDFNQLAILFVNWDTQQQVPAFGTITKSGDFTATVTFTDSQKGRYMVGAILFFPGAGSQATRSLFTPIFVE